MDKIRFTDGWEAGIDEVQISHTYAGLIVGKPGQITEGWLKANAQHSTEKNWGKRNWTAVPNPTKEGWGHAWKVLLWLSANYIPEDLANGGCGSDACVALTLTLDYSKPLPEQIEAVIGHLKWTDIAKNYDL